MHQRERALLERVMQRAGARLERADRLRPAERKRPALVRHPAAEEILQKPVDAAVRELARAHARQRRDYVELQVPVREVAPGAEQDLMRQEVLHLALQPSKKFEVALDRERLCDDAKQLLAFFEGEGEPVCLLSS